MYGRNTREQGQRKASRMVPYQDLHARFSHSEWEENAARREWSPRLGGVICHICYTPAEHYEPESTLNLGDQVQVITYYEDLTDADLEYTEGKIQNSEELGEQEV